MIFTKILIYSEVNFAYYLGFFFFFFEFNKISFPKISSFLVFCLTINIYFNGQDRILILLAFFNVSWV